MIAMFKTFFKNPDQHFVSGKQGTHTWRARGCSWFQTSKNMNMVKSPFCTPSRGRHEHGLLNLFPSMEGISHLHVLVAKDMRCPCTTSTGPTMSRWCFPLFNNTGVRAARSLIKELSYHGWLWTGTAWKSWELNARVSGHSSL